MDWQSSGPPMDGDLQRGTTPKHGCWLRAVHNAKSSARNTQQVSAGFGDIQHVPIWHAYPFAAIDSLRNLIGGGVRGPPFFGAIGEHRDEILHVGRIIG